MPDKKAPANLPCIGCDHWRRLYPSGGKHKTPHVCHYILDTGRRRGDTVENCTKRISGGNIA